MPSWCWCRWQISVGIKARVVNHIQIATNRWPFLLCCKLAHVVHLSRCVMLPGLYGHAVCTMHCRSICLTLVPLPSRLILQCTHQRPPPLLISRLIAVVVLGTRLRCCYSAIVYSHEHSARSDFTLFNLNG